MSGEREHALLSASSAEKWLNCPASARLEEQLPDTESDYAAEGTFAHEVAEYELNVYLDKVPTLDLKKRRKQLEENPLYTNELKNAVEVYLDYVKDIIHSCHTPPFVAVEKRVDYSDYAPEGFGTIDCLIISGTTMWVIDFKYGKGVQRHAYGNPQLMYYALGALQESKIFSEIEDVYTVIVQPRLNHLPQGFMKAKEIIAWGEENKPRAELAFAGGSHCRFCKAKAMCKKRAEEFLSLEEYAGTSQSPGFIINNDELGDILTRARHLKEWVSSLEEYALAELLKGKEVKGWKAVEGRSNRTFSDVEKVFEVLKANGFDEALLFERKPLTLTKIEELTGKPKFKELLSDHVIKPKGKPALVEQSDKREPYKTDTAEDDFKNLIENKGAN